MSYAGLILTSGNSSSFPFIETSCRELGIALEGLKMSGGGKAYRFPSADLDKLPTDDDGPICLAVKIPDTVFTILILLMLFSANAERESGH